MVKKIWLKEVLTMTENNRNGFRVLPCLRIWNHLRIFIELTPDHFSVNFWLCSLYLLVMTSWFSLCCLKQWFLKPVSFEASKNFQRFKFCSFSPTRPQFSRVCLSSWWEVTPISLTFAQKQALVLGRPGIRNSPIEKTILGISRYWN